MSSQENFPTGYIYDKVAECNTSHRYLVPKLLELMEIHCPPGGRVLDVGCGNGSVANEVSGRGYDVVGIEPSEQGLAAARAAFPDLDIRQAVADVEKTSNLEAFDFVYSLEVVEHVFLPRKFAQFVFESVRPGGSVAVSTPYHGYLKNLAIAATGSFDRHVNPLWDYGHIKFWSHKTLESLLTEAGFISVDFHHVGRIPGLAKSMFAVCSK